MYIYILYETSISNQKTKNKKRSIARQKHDIRFCWHFLLGTSFGRALKQQAHSVSFRLTDSHAVWVYNLSLPKNSLKIISTVKSHISIILLIIHRKKYPQCLFFYCAKSPSSMPQPRCAWSFGYDPKPFWKNSPRWRPQTPPEGQGAQLPADPSRLLVILLKSTEICGRFSTVKPFNGWVGSHPGWDVCEAPQPRDILFVCSKSQVWSLGRILVDSVPYDFATPLFFEGGGGTQSFIYFGPAWNRRKTEASLLQLGCLHHGNSSASNFLHRNFSRFVERSKTTYVPPPPRKTNMTSWKNHHCLIGDTSSNGGLFHCHVSFQGPN